MTGRNLTRRRTISIMAVAAGATVLGGAYTPLQSQEWTGTALGADARLVFDGLDRSRAEHLIAMTLAEIERLEQIFSLYRPDSEISRLNQAGLLKDASQDLRIVLSQAIRFWHVTGGAFNPAIQPVWRLVSDHFSSGSPQAEPDAGAIRDALRLCDPARIAMRDRTIGLAPGMAITLNGIAQGYITDQVARLLLHEGVESVLVQLGEIRALPGRAWRIAIEGTGRDLGLRDGALATSAGQGTPLSADGRWHHLIDPLTGQSANQLRSVTVRASSAMVADALSTALAVAGPRAMKEIAEDFPQAGVHAVLADGGTISVGRDLFDNRKSNG